MSSVIEDVKNTGLIINSQYEDITSENYDRLFFATNEKLNELFSYVDIRGKKILSVVGSGDQIFHLYNMGAKKVDLFDINKLSFYYFYLRLWNMIYMNGYYIPVYFDNSYIEELLKKVSPQCTKEKEALQYWKMLINSYSLNYESLFFRTNMCNCENNQLSDFSKAVDSIITGDFNFYNIDITKDINIDEKYDIIVVSNISDWIECLCGNMRMYKYNLFNLLKYNGCVLSSNVNFSTIKEIERKLFRQCFDIIEFSKDENSSYYDFPAGYVYKKIYRC